MSVQLYPSSRLTSHLAFFFLCALFFLPLACSQEIDSRCPPINERIDDQPVPDNSRCCVVLQECCEQLPDTDASSTDDDKLICFKRAQEGALLTCQSLYQTYFFSKRCIPPPP